MRSNPSFTDLQQDTEFLALQKEFFDSYSKWNKLIAEEKSAEITHLTTAILKTSRKILIKFTDMELHIMATIPPLKKELGEKNLTLLNALAHFFEKIYLSAKASYQKSEGHHDSHWENYRILLALYAQVNHIILNFGSAIEKQYVNRKKVADEICQLLLLINFIGLQITDRQKSLKWFSDGSSIPFIKEDTVLRNFSLVIYNLGASYFQLDFYYEAASEFINAVEKRKLISDKLQIDSEGICSAYSSLLACIAHIFPDNIVKDLVQTQPNLSEENQTHLKLVLIGLLNALKKLFSKTDSQTNQTTPLDMCLDLAINLSDALSILKHKFHLQHPVFAFISSLLNTLHHNYKDPEFPNKLLVKIIDAKDDKEKVKLIHLSKVLHPLFVLPTTKATEEYKGSTTQKATGVDTKPKFYMDLSGRSLVRPRLQGLLKTSPSTTTWPRLFQKESELDSFFKNFRR